MSVQVPMLDAPGAKSSKAAAPVEETLGRGFDVKSFVENFEVLAEEKDGLDRLRSLVRALAVEGRLTRPKGESVAAGGEGWHRLALGDIGQWGSGGTPLRTNTAYYGGDICWLKIGDLTDADVWGAEESITHLGLANSSAKLVPSGAVLVAMYGSIGKLGLVRKECATNQAIAHCVPDAAVVTAQYLMLLLRHHREAFIFQGKGAAQQNISQTVLKAFQVALPPLPEQKRIVAKVDELMRLLDDLEGKQVKKRETQVWLRTAALDALTSAETPEEFEAAWRRVTDNFEVLFERAESIPELRSALVDTAIRGVLTQREPVDGDAHPLVAEMGRKVGYASEVEEPPFRLPSTWEWSRLGALSRDVRYGYTASARHERAGVRLLRITDIQNDRVNWETVPGCEIDALKLASFALGDGDLVIARTGGTIGKTYLVQGLTVRAVFASYLIRVAPIAPMSPAYLKVFTGSGLYWKQLYAGSAGTGQPNVNATTLRTLAVPVPPPAEQRRIVAKVEHLMKLCDDLEAKLHRAETTAAKLAEAVVAEMVRA
jgi:type I restriction enzyme S subunit